MASNYQQALIKKELRLANRPPACVFLPPDLSCNNSVTQALLPVSNLACSLQIYIVSYGLF